MTVQDYSSPLLFMEHANKPKPGLHRGVVDISSKEIVCLYLYYWCENGQSVLSYYSFDVRRHGEIDGVNILIRPYPESRYPDVSDIKHVTISIKTKDCHYCCFRNTPCQCPFEMAGKSHVIHPQPNILFQKNGWEVWKWTLRKTCGLLSHQRVIEKDPSTNQVTRKDTYSFVVTNREDSPPNESYYPAMITMPQPPSILAPVPSMPTHVGNRGMNMNITNSIPPLFPSDPIMTQSSSWHALPTPGQTNQINPTPNNFVSSNVFPSLPSQVHAPDQQNQLQQQSQQSRFQTQRTVSEIMAGIPFSAPIVINPFSSTLQLPSLNRYEPNAMGNHPLTTNRQQPPPANAPTQTAAAAIAAVGMNAYAGDSNAIGGFSASGSGSGAVPVPHLVNSNAAEPIPENIRRSIENHSSALASSSNSNNTSNNSKKRVNPPDVGVRVDMAMLESNPKRVRGENTAAAGTSTGGSGSGSGPRGFPAGLNLPRNTLAGSTHPGSNHGGLAAPSHSAVGSNLDTGRQKSAVPMECHMCDAKFSRKHDLKRHIRTRHERQRNFQCEVCSKKFLLKWHLKAHMNTIHEKKKSYSCELCQATFGTSSNWRKHLRNVHSIETKSQNDEDKSPVDGQDAANNDEVDERELDEMEELEESEAQE